MRRAIVILLLIASAACSTPMSATRPLSETGQALPITAYNCSISHDTPHGTVQIEWRLLPDGKVIAAEGHWSSRWQRDALGIWVGWFSNTDSDPLKPDTMLAFTAPSDLDKALAKRRLRMELRIPGSSGNVHAMSFATPFPRHDNASNMATANWGEVFALAKGAGLLEVRFVDKRGRIHGSTGLDFRTLEEAGHALRAAQGEMIDQAKDYKARCSAFSDDPYDRDIIVT